jgi:molecular chaperone GrpE
MMKKKNVRTEEVENNEAGEVTDNKEFNSQDENSYNIHDGETEDSGEDVEVKESREVNNSQEVAEPAKETSQEPTTEAKLAEMQDRYLRLSAEFDNYRKRTLREKIELTKHAGENLLINIIPVMDDFERALKAMDSSADFVAMKAGIDLIYNKFKDFLSQNGIKEIEAINSVFNVDLHDALSKMPVEDESMKGKVVEVIQKGYYLHEKVLRHSKVIVGE